MPDRPQREPAVLSTKRTKAYLWAALVLLIVIVVIDFDWKNFSGTLGEGGGRLRHALNLQLFSLGKASISVLFLLKAVLFLLLLSTVIRWLRHQIYTRLRHTAMGESRAYLLARFTSIVLYGLGLLAGLEWTGLNLNTLAIVGGTLGIGVGFGLQQIVSNWVAGLVLMIEQPVRIGDVISVRELAGTIIRIGGRSTWVRTYDDEVVIIPNSDLTTHQVVNWTANDLKVRLTLPVGVSYGSDPEQVRNLLLHIMDENSEVLKTPPPEVIFKDLGDSSLDFLLRFWAEVSPDRDHYGLKSDLYFAILKSFREQGIEIPFPQRDVHLRSADAQRNS
jgi:small-conductance mechanosensitive channel